MSVPNDATSGPGTEDVPSEARVKEIKIAVPSTKAGGPPRVVDIAPVPVHVGNIKFEGLDNTNEAFLRRELAFAGVDESKRVIDLAHSLQSSLARMERYGIFKSTSIDVDRSDKTGDVDLVVKVKEKKRTQFRAELLHEVGGDTFTGLSGTLNNAFGNAEKLSASARLGFFGGHSFTAGLQKPRFWHRRITSDFSIYNRLRNQSWVSSFEERERGTSIGFSDETGRHAISWEGSWRDISPVDRPITGRDIYTSTYAGPSRSILESCTPSVKSAVKYTLTHDRRDHIAAPLRGHFTQWMVEAAGLGGDAKYLKTEATAQYYQPFSSSFSMGIGAKAGVMRPWATLFNTTGDRTIPISDRFWLGHQLNLRHFQPFTIGPRDQDDSLGGEAVGVVGLHALWSPPSEFMREYRMQLHAFANVGNCVALPQHGILTGVVDRSASEIRASTGVGIVIPVSGMGRIEINVGTPIKSTSTDKAANFQFGIGLDFV